MAIEYTKMVIEYTKLFKEFNKINIEYTIVGNEYTTVYIDYTKSKKNTISLVIHSPSNKVTVEKKIGQLILHTCRRKQVPVAPLKMSPVRLMP